MVEVLERPRETEVRPEERPVGAIGPGERAETSPVPARPEYEPWFGCELMLWGIWIGSAGLMLLAFAGVFLTAAYLTVTGGPR